jgi:hypothetical protein
MNNVLSLVQAACTFPDPDSGWCADEMLSELLVLHDEMIMQLHFERLEVVGRSDFPTSMIDRHDPSSPAKPVPMRKNLLSGGSPRASAV